MVCSMAGGNGKVPSLTRLVDHLYHHMKNRPAAVALIATAVGHLKEKKGKLVSHITGRFFFYYVVIPEC